MRPISVYRVDYVSKTKVRIGTVVERRGMERGDNPQGLLSLARRTFASSPQEAFLTIIDWKEAKRIQGWEGKPSRPGSAFSPSRL